MYVHCNAQKMNLAFQDAVSKVNMCRDAMMTVKELINTTETHLKDWHGLTFSVSLQMGTVCARFAWTMRVSGWTMRVSSVKSVLVNFERLASYFHDFLVSKLVTET